MYYGAVYHRCQKMKVEVGGWIKIDTLNDFWIRVNPAAAMALGKAQGAGREIRFETKLVTDGGKKEGENKNREDDNIPHTGRSGKSERSKIPSNVHPNDDVEEKEQRNNRIQEGAL